MKLRNHTQKRKNYNEKRTEAKRVKIDNKGTTKNESFLFIELKLLW